MASQKAIGERHNTAIREAVEVLARLDEELGPRAARANHGPDHGIPSPTKRPGETAALHAEIMLSLARTLDERLPRKRGRPRKSEARV